MCCMVGRIGRTDEVEEEEEEHARTDVEDLRSANKEDNKDTGNETDREMKPVFMKGLFRCVFFSHSFYYFRRKLALISCSYS